MYVNHVSTKPGQGHFGLRAIQYFDDIRPLDVGDAPISDHRSDVSGEGRLGIQDCVS